MVPIVLDGETIGTLKLTGTPIKYSETPGVIRRPPPLLGEHTDQVLAEAAYSRAEIAALRAEGVAGSRAGEDR